MENITDLLLQYAGTFVLLATVAVPFVTEAFFTYIWQPMNKLLNTLIVMVISLILTFSVWVVGGWLATGFLSEITVWWHVALDAIGAGAVAKWT